MLMGITAALPSLSKVHDSTHDACARRGGTKLNTVLLKPARVKWHKTTEGFGQSFKPSGNLWDERDERKEELPIE